MMYALRTQRTTHYTLSTRRVRCTHELREEHDEPDLAHQGRLAAHVGARDEHHRAVAAAVRLQVCVCEREVCVQLPGTGTLEI